MPRMPERPAVLDARRQAIHDRIAAGPRGKVEGPLALWLHSPDVAERAQHLGEHLRYGSSLEPRLSELVILTVAAHHRCRYEWYVHAPIAEQRGLEPAVIEALRAGKEPRFARDDEALLHRFCRRLLEDKACDAETFGAARARFGEQGIVDVTAIMGYYSMIAFLLNAVEFDPPMTPQPFERPQAGA